MEPTPQGCWMDFAAKKERSWVKCGTKGKENTPSPKVLCQFSIVQPCSSQKMDPLQDWSASTAGCGSHAWHMSWPTWVELECKSVAWFKPNHWISSVSQVDIPSPIPSASSLRSRFELRPRPHPVKDPPLDAHQWFMYKGTTIYSTPG